MRTRTLFRLLPLLSLSLLLGACSHYRLGTGAKLAFSSLYVAPVESKTFLPQSKALVGTQVRQVLLRDGRVSLESSEQTADAVLSLTLKSFNRDASVARRDDTGLARRFNLKLVVSCTLTLRDGTKLLDGREITVTREDWVDQGQLQAEYEILPVIAEKLAVELSHAILDTW